MDERLTAESVATILRESYPVASRSVVSSDSRLRMRFSTNRYRRHFHDAMESRHCNSAAALGELSDGLVNWNDPETLLEGAEVGAKTGPYQSISLGVQICSQNVVFWALSQGKRARIQWQMHIDDHVYICGQRMIAAVVSVSSCYVPTTS